MDVIAKMPTYESYKDSGVEWLGEVPESWTSAPLKYLLTMVSEKISSANSDLPYIGMENIESWSGRIIGAPSEVEGLANRFKKDDILFGKLRPYLAKVTNPNFGGICSTELLVYRCKNLNSRFYKYFLGSKSFIDLVDGSTYGSKMPRANSDFIGNQRLPAPSLDQQTQIANFLDQKTAQIDEAIAIKQQQIALLKERKQIIIQKAVTQGLNPDVPMKDSGVDWIGEIPAHWEVVKLKHLFKENTRRSKTGQETLLSLRMVSGLVPHNDVSDKPIPADNLIDYKIVGKGQMVMNRMRAAIGIFGLANDYGLVSPDYAVFDVTDNVIADYYLTLFKLPLMGVQFRLASKGMGTGSSGFMRLYTDQFGDIKVATPPKTEQVTLMQFIAATEEKNGVGVGYLLTQIEKLKEYKSTLINSAVTGKIRITPDMVV